MMTVAASLALYQLIFKPHYWEKTKHGLHLRSSHSSSGRTTVEEEPQSGVTMQLPAFTSTKHASPPLPAPHSFSASTTVEEEPRSVATMQSPAFTSTKCVPPLLPAPHATSASTAYHGRSAWWTMITLPAPRASSASTAEEEDLEVTDKRPAIRNARHLSSPLPASPSFSGSATEEEDHEVIEKLPTVRRAQRLFVHYLKRLPWQQWLKDPWLITTLVIACIASITSCWYFFQHHQLLLYGDAISHLRIARRVFVNTPPGLAQLGGVWLPLPQLLMLPFIWNDYLWRTGLAGSFPSMLCYVVAAVYLFFSARRLTHDSRASFVGTLLFILNPNILYLQSTPLSETVCIATSVMACYYFLAWTQDNHPKHLVGVAAGTFLATLSRFDGWGLLLALLVLIVVLGWSKRQHLAQIEGTLIVFVTLAGLGIGLWFLWDGVIFGDPLYFHHYLYSSAANEGFYTYHNLLQSIIAYMLTSIETVGPILFVLGAIAVVVFVFRCRLAPDMFGAMAFLTPFVFYILLFYFGQDTIYLPGNTSHTLWNVRFGAEIVAPAALFLATLAEGWSISMPARIRPLIGQIVLVIDIVIQTTLTASGGIISLQDAQYGSSCARTEHMAFYLAQHYAGGRILEDANASDINESEIGIDLKNTIYEGSAELWKKALNDPASMVEWIIVSPDAPGDPIAKRIDLESPAFLSQFTLVVQEQDSIMYGSYRLSLYHRHGRSPLPKRPIPASLLTDHRLCHSGA